MANGLIFFDRPGQLDPTQGPVTAPRKGLFSALGNALQQAGLAIDGRPLQAVQLGQQARRQELEVQKLFQDARERRGQIEAQRKFDEFLMKSSDFSPQQVQAARIELERSGDPTKAIGLAKKLGINDDLLLKRQKLELQVDQLRAQNKFLESISKKGGVDASQFAPGSSVTVAGIKVPLNRKFTESETKSLTTADALNTDIAELKSLIRADLDKPLSQQAQFSGSLPFGLFTEGGQRFALLKDNIGERLLRLRSGAQINEKEFQRFRKLLPSIFRRDSLDIEQLQKFENEFSAIKGRILSGAVFDKDKNEFTVPNNQESNNDVLKRLGLDPNRFEIIEE